MVNLVQLLADMRANSAFGHNFGISVTLAPDLWYLQHYDAKGLLANADWLGFMAYDLHGIWDANTPNVGNKVFGQTNISDIANDAIPLWYDLAQSDMARVNVSAPDLAAMRRQILADTLKFGLTAYGRGYTLSDPSCNTAGTGCLWSAGSNPGPCTAEAGIMSMTEINNLIAEKNLVPTAIGDTTMVSQSSRESTLW
jgi:chitinase